MSKKLYVGNMSFSSTEESIKELFSQYGEVVSIKIPKDQMTGRPRGFCFVEMENAEEAINQLNNYTFDGRALKVNIARENPAGGSGSNGGGGRSFGGHGGGGRPGFGNRNRQPRSYNN